MPHADPVEATVLTGDAVDPLPWAEVRERLAEAHSSWFATTHRAGRPHVRPVLTVWVDGTLHTTSSPAASKARNVADDGRCSISVTTDGLDLVLEGTARLVTDTAQLERIRDAYADKYGWPVTVVDGAFDAPYGAPTAGPPPYVALEIVPTAVYAFGTDADHGPRTTRFRF